VPELRIDPLSGLRTIIAGARADRPGGGFHVEPALPLDPDDDPFLEGHEDRTPPEVWALRPHGGEADGPGWSVRVVPNRYPALGDEGTRGDVDEAGGAAVDPARDAGPPGSDGGGSAPADPLAGGRGQPELFAARAAEGAHEVIVSAPGPARSLAELDLGQLETALSVWRERMRAHAGASYVHLIVNEGAEAGASLPHSHAQLYALPFVPAAIARERERFTAYAERTGGRDLLADLLQEEVRRGERTFALDREAVALCPFASRVPYQVQVVPRAARPRFEDDGPLGAALLREVLGRLAGALGAVPAFNLWVRTAPRGAEHFCWRIDLLPKLTHLAGLEIGAGLHLNALPPERAASALRDVEPRLPPAVAGPPPPPS
jgi:UDPglucose--hexose-1-phosphate uridylyltransferase